MEEKQQQEIDLTKVYDYAEYPDKVDDVTIVIQLISKTL